MSRRPGARKMKHAFAYRRRIRCRCGGHLIGERAENRYTYYHCHVCHRVCVREEVVDVAAVNALPHFPVDCAPAERMHAAACTVVFDGSGIVVKVRQEIELPRVRVRYGSNRFWAILATSWRMKNGPHMPFSVERVVWIKCGLQWTASNHSSNHTAG